MTAPTETDRSESSGPATVRDPGSYRDPGGFVYRRDGVLHRQIGAASIDDWRLILTGELPVVFELFGSRPSVSGELGSIMKVLPALFPSARS